MKNPGAITKHCCDRDRFTVVYLSVPRPGMLVHSSLLAVPLMEICEFLSRLMEHLEKLTL